MKILLTTHHLNNLAGSEIFTYTLADFLKRQNIEVSIYSKYSDRLKFKFDQLNIPIHANIQELVGEKFDTAHVHHNINALEVRHYFPELPIVYLAHGVIPLLEQPPLPNLQISFYLAVSQGVKEHLIKNGVEKKRVKIFRNIFDSEKFRLENIIHKRPEEILVISSRMDKEREDIVRKTAKILNAKVRFVGGRFGWVNQMELAEHIKQSDVVFTLGRGAVEAMLSGRIPFIYDYQGGDGLVTPNNFKEILKHNFSGRRYAKEYLPEKMAHEIEENYQQQNGKKLRRLALEYFNAEDRIGEIIDLYQVIKKDYPIRVDKRTKKQVERIVGQIHVVRDYEHEACAYRINELNKKVENLNKKIGTRNHEIHRLRHDIEALQDLKIYKIWNMINICRNKVMKK